MKKIAMYASLVIVPIALVYFKNDLKDYFFGINDFPVIEKLKAHNDVMVNEKIDDNVGNILLQNSNFSAYPFYLNFNNIKDSTALNVQNFLDFIGKDTLETDSLIMYFTRNNSNLNLVFHIKNSPNYYVITNQTLTLIPYPQFQTDSIDYDSIRIQYGQTRLTYCPTRGVVRDLNVLKASNKNPTTMYLHYIHIIPVSHPLYKQYTKYNENKLATITKLCDDSDKFIEYRDVNIVCPNRCPY